ncbi:MAG: hypothetical protein JST74_11590 [Bacteroidetes bacterium]|nr:hypothetical protein [Bacteroidota bacterium]
MRLFCLVLLILTGCHCENTSYYQIKLATPDATLNWKCHYIAEGMGTCATWQKTPQIIFADSCGKFVLSQVVSKSQLTKYQ